MIEEVLKGIGITKKPDINQREKRTHTRTHFGALNEERRLEHTRCKRSEEK